MGIVSSCFTKDTSATVFYFIAYGFYQTLIMLSLSAFFS